MVHKLTFPLAFLIPAMLVSGTDSARPIERARDLYLKGVDGDRNATRQSSEIFRSLAKQRPHDPVIAAYLGSNDLLDSGRTLAVWKKGKLAKDGLTALDNAVASDPNSIEIRFVRAISTYHLPAFFKREQQCESDLAAIAPKVGEAVVTGSLDKRLGAAALFYYGLIRERKGDRKGAERAWRGAALTFPDTPAGAEAARRLRGA
ncbi:MAG: hypothetical protein H7Y20_05695 [Bryobacteraceae bacterium]|nr:hypothetical protein [Bryobacteraceae bacterium]